MIPIKDHSPSGRLPVFTYLLIAVNTAVFVFMIILSPSAFEAFLYEYALVPRVFLAGEQWIALFSSMFLHGGLGHLLSNMLFLYIFGDNLEDKLGHFVYLAFYLICGLAATGLQILVNPNSLIPQLGASGAIAGVMGGYLVLFPRNKIEVIIPLGWIFRRATVPAYFMLFYWVAFQFLFGVGSLASMNQAMGGVAYFAHVGGFAAGWLLIKLFVNNRGTEIL